MKEVRSGIVGIFMSTLHLRMIINIEVKMQMIFCVKHFVIMAYELLQSRITL